MTTQYMWSGVVAQFHLQTKLLDEYCRFHRQNSDITKTYLTFSTEPWLTQKECNSILNLSANVSTGLIWKLCCNWLKGFQQHYSPLVTRGHFTIRWYMISKVIFLLRIVWLFWNLTGAFLAELSRNSSKRYGNFKYQFRRFMASRNLNIGRLNGYRKGSGYLCWLLVYDMIW